MEVVRLDPQVGAEVYQKQGRPISRRTSEQAGYQHRPTVIDLPTHLLVHKPTERDEPYLDKCYHAEHGPRQRVHGDIVDRLGNARITINVDLAGILEDCPQFRDLARCPGRKSDSRSAIRILEH
jgi:hypothetical protein